MDPVIFSLIIINGFFHLQDQPCDDIGPTEAFILLHSYEKRTKETLDPKKLEDGTLKLSDLLTEEDFAMAHHPSCMILTSFGSPVPIFETFCHVVLM